jgi:hypothetical protein
LALVTSAIVAVSAPAAQAAFGVEKLFAGNCLVNTCGEGAKVPTLKEAEEQGYRQAGGHPPFGVTDFRLTTFTGIGPLKATVPQASVKNVRVDVAAGVVTNPESVPKCSMKDFEASPVEPIPGVHAHTKSTCPASSEIGVNKVETVVEVAKGVFKDYVLEGAVYNLEQPVGLGSDFGVALNLEPIFGAPIYSHTFIEGNVEWATDYHDYFIIKNVTPGLIESRLTFTGNAAGTSGFLRNPSVCSVAGPETTTNIEVESYEGASEKRPYELPIGTNGCEAEGFSPSFKLVPETTKSDVPDGITPELTATHPEKASETDTSDLKTATVTLPPGMTMNPSAAAGLEGCTPEQFGIGTRKETECPSHSKLGHVNLDLPTLPPGSLHGPIYLGKPAGKSIEAPPYTIYLDAESARYGVKVRLKGTVSPNLATGQMTATFNENPQAPFNNVSLHFNNGAFAPIANPLACETGKTTTSFTAFSGGAPLTGEIPFTTEGCASSPPPFKLGQSSSAAPAVGGSSATFTLNYERPDGNQYISQIRTVLPAGLVGIIPSVPLCPEAQANAGSCGATSQIGDVTVAAGAGPSPYMFPGKVYLSGPFEGSPYSLSVVVPNVAGPFNLGNTIARVKLDVDPHSARVIASDTKVPTIVGGIPIRLKSLTFTLNRQGFERNPTNCGPLLAESTLTGTLGAVTSVASAFQVEGCNSLGFKPSFAATTTSKISKANGASLLTKVAQAPGEANIKSVVVRLPKQLPSRLTTLQKACPEATFAANPFSCPSGSNVGTATAVTPTLPAPLSGPAYLVSHGGAAFPDLDLVVEGNNGVRVILVGNTDIKKGVTTTSFLTTPDVPVTSFTVNLPTGPHSALGAVSDLCAVPLVMPTTITGQNGKVVKQNTRIAVTGCGVRIVGVKVIGKSVFLTVQTFGPGRISASGSGLSSASRKLSSASRGAGLKLSLTSRGRSRRRPIHIKVRVGFVPTKGAHSTAFKTVTFR